MSRSQQLAQRRKELIVRSAVIRTDLLADAYLLRHAIEPARVGADLWQTVRENKMMIAGVLLATVVIKPRRILAGLKNGLLAFQALRSAAPLLKNFMTLQKRP